MGSDFWKFSSCTALQHLIPFWWFERRDDNRGWHDLECKQKFSLQKQCKIKHKGNMAFALFTWLPWRKWLCCHGLAKMLLLFFKLIITPSPHHLTSASQQNTSKPSLHKKGTQQPLWGVSWDCLLHITLLSECVSPKSTQTSSFMSYFAEDSNYSSYVHFSTNTRSNKLVSFWAENRRRVMKLSVIQFSICYCTYNTD